ncbi:TNF receptor-associated factor 6 isoform X2 [Lingula anatina]|uniref:RING-type E3 ubiquitin transferase n=1 Tax=Lingula anatina TaxID=7574 RepID=A0A1S3J0Y2_LINAN|nr:TNF receptor-associated factor 6 isoform X2 [Lingula anatina]|eukprot:XP_013403469.1 TNF receptor-associated factor 6 isoform X2 [Lingula anatina]
MMQLADGVDVTGEFEQNIKLPFTMKTCLVMNSPEKVFSQPTVYHKSNVSECRTGESSGERAQMMEKGEPQPRTPQGELAEEPLEGYDFDFCPPLDSKYECPICLMCLRDPYQTYCGHRFCKYCIFKWLREEKHRCPVDNVLLDEQNIYPDNFAKREILGLKLKCPNYSHGCRFIIELCNLESHLQSCFYALIPCPQCCPAVLPRKDLKDHIEQSCPRRYVQCDYCFQSIFLSSKQKHLSECPFVPTQCKYCDILLTREKLKKHIRTECQKAIVKCRFYEFGCKTEVRRSCIDEHEEQQSQQHLWLLCGAVKELYRLLYTIVPQGVSPLPSLGAPASAPPVLTHTDLQLDDQLTSLNLSDDSSLNALPSSDFTNDLPALKNAILQVRRLIQLHVKPINFNPESTQMMNITKIESDPTAMQSARFDSQQNAPPQEHESVLSSVQTKKLQSLQEKTAYQDERMTGQSQQLKETQAKLSSIEKKLDEYRIRTRQLESQVSEMEARSCNGNFYWVIKNYSRLRREAMSGDNTVLHSPGFYTSFHGYKLCVRLNLNGVDSAHGTHLSLFIHFMQGEFDSFLEWPFGGRITLTIMDQNEACELRQHITETLIAKPHLAAFQKPRAHRNHKGFGYMEFAPLSLIENSQYVKNDSLIIHAQVVAQ